MNKTLKYIAINLLLLLLCLNGLRAQELRLNGLNGEIAFAGDYLSYKGKEIRLGPKAFYIDGQLSDEEVKAHRYVFNSVNEASRHLTNGTETDPMILYIAPWVYWIDDPDDPGTRMPKTVGGTPFGLEIECDWLKFSGLSDNPRDVVLASNRGQTMGAKGNFTMFLIRGDGTSTENVTFGNYCNIDFEYPLNPALNREKRGSAIVQAQLVFTIGDKLFARNTHFVSRLNLAPFWGGKRTLFHHCHFESTDDALAPTGVYLNSTFDIYSSKPFGHTEGTGAVLLDCAIRSFTRGEQYWVKGPGQLATLDCRMETHSATYWGWRAEPALESRYYHFNNSINEKPVVIGSQHPFSTVDMADKPLLDAYRFEYGGKVVYNIYNLLRGEDEWDPLGLKEMVLSAEKADTKTYTGLPTQLIVSSSGDSLETGKKGVVLSASALRFGNYESACPKVKWSVAPEFGSLVRLDMLDDNSCQVTSINKEDETKMVVVLATTDYGLEGAAVLSVSPEMVEAPDFNSLPMVVMNADGMMTVHYSLDMTFKDQSLVTWYRCANGNGGDPVEVAVSRFHEPCLDYTLTSGDIGWYIMAKVEPKHSRCVPGEPQYAIMQRAVRASDVKADRHSLVVNLKNMSTRYQPEVKEGFFTLDCFAPLDTKEHDWEATTDSDPWYYGKGVDGAAADSGLVQANKGARLRYTPAGKGFGDMTIRFTAVPAKTAGQGFSSARQQYMDIFIKFDNEELNGYALRLIRTTKYSDAIDFILMRYDDGVASPISEPVSADCYRPDCRLEIKIEGSRFMVHAENPRPYHVIPDRPEVVQVVDMEMDVPSNNRGGFGFQHTGTVEGGATLIKDLKVEWK
ncbi:MAG: hypothetical protein VB074_09865 [Proteiniphilum sp.]|jgi:hypothetical protein|uniref:hypothetical protein n=1 Tax=Proteiniphilum sp. TaxID=1926877 RepID=UPI002B208184|nr:hypothetical protein [Proteiniphilum sp.]MEA5128480.1 hypothetical protein [Proteiniphilum sp.]